MREFIRWAAPITNPKWWVCVVAGWAFSGVLFKGGYLAADPFPTVMFLAAAAGLYYAGVQDALSRFGEDDGPDDGDDPEPDIDPTGPGGLERELAELIAKDMKLAEVTR